MSDVRAIEDLFGELIELESPAERRNAGPPYPASNTPRTVSLRTRDAGKERPFMHT